MTLPFYPIHDYAAYLFTTFIKWTYIDQSRINFCYQHTKLCIHIQNKLFLADQSHTFFPFPRRISFRMKCIFTLLIAEKKSGPQIRTVRSGMNPSPKEVFYCFHFFITPKKYSSRRLDQVNTSCLISMCFFRSCKLLCILRFVTVLFLTFYSRYVIMNHLFVEVDCIEWCLKL